MQALPHLSGACRVDIDQLARCRASGYIASRWPWHATHIGWGYFATESNINFFTISQRCCQVQGDEIGLVERSSCRLSQLVDPCRCWMGVNASMFNCSDHVDLELSSTGSDRGFSCRCIAI